MSGNLGWFKDFSELMDFCNKVAASKQFMDGNTPLSAESILVRVCYGMGLGIDPIPSITNIKNIRGNLTLSAAMVGGLIKGSKKYNYSVVEHSNTVCKIEIFENNKSVGFSEFTQADAAKAGTAGNANYNKFPRNFLLARAITNAARWYCPDIFKGGVYTEDELQDGFNQSEFVDTESQSTVSQQSKPLTNFVQRDTLRQVMSANVDQQSSGVTLDHYINRINQLRSEYTQLLIAAEENATVTVPDNLEGLSKDELTTLGRGLTSAIDALKKKLQDN